MGVLHEATGRPAHDSQHLLLDVEHHATVARLSVAGEIDGSEIARFDGALASALATGAARIELDLGQVDFLGSQGVRSMVLAHRDASGKGAHLVVVSLSRIVERVLDVSDLLPLFTDRGGPPS